MKITLLNNFLNFIITLLLLVAAVQIDLFYEWLGKIRICKSIGIVCYPDKTVSKLDVYPPDGQRHLTYYYGPGNTLLYLVWRNKGEDYDNITSFFYPNGVLIQEQTSYDNGSRYRVDTYSSAGLLMLRKMINKEGVVSRQEKYYPNGILWELEEIDKTVKCYHPSGDLYIDTKETQMNNKTQSPSGECTKSLSNGERGSVLITKYPNRDVECYKSKLQKREFRGFLQNPFWNCRPNQQSK